MIRARHAERPPNKDGSNGEGKRHAGSLSWLRLREIFREHDAVPALNDLS